MAVITDDPIEPANGAKVLANKAQVESLEFEPKNGIAKRIYTFGKSRAEGDKSMKYLLGGKGANLAEMAKIGLLVPSGLTITTECCEEFHGNNCSWPEGLWESILDGIRVIEQDMELKLGDEKSPLLLSVRSGAAVSMPGMMDTVLNLGLNDVVVEGLAKLSGTRFAYDSYRRFIDMFGDVVMSVPHSLYEEQLAAMKQRRNAKTDTDLTADDLKELVSTYKKVYKTATGSDFPTDPLVQLKLSIEAVFNSWNSKRAIKYRAINQIKGLKGTAVNIQAMVFGNMGDNSGTGVLFTRNPSTGEKKMYGEYLINAQGEDVVAGIRTPQSIEKMKDVLPEAYEQLCRNCDILEAHYKDMMDIEFTVQKGHLWMLQCRTGKRTGAGAVRIAVEMVKEGLATPEKAVTMVEPRHLDQLLHPQFANPDSYKEKVLGTGLPASPGAAIGQIVFRADVAEAWHAKKKKVILVRLETSPEDVGGMNASTGIVTARGGMTSHAAVVARGWGKCCVVGCSQLTVDDDHKSMTLGGKQLREGDWISLNGTTGEIIEGIQALDPPVITPDLEAFMQWVDQRRKLNVLANADSPKDAEIARKNGAQGIGLCRTEHMFFLTEDRIRAVRKMIMAKTEELRRSALDLILPFQRSDFQGIFEAMDGLPVTIRLLDPPLHEFFPEAEVHEIAGDLARDLQVSEHEIIDRITEIREVNPMMGFRGCRLGIVYPELTETQCRAIFEAAVAAQSRGCKVFPEIMVPLIGSPKELENQVDLVRAVAGRVFADSCCSVPYKVGTMIEVPRAVLFADKIAEFADFFSFGTNDLTQMTFGFSRDDSGKFVPRYVALGILPNDPFQVLDEGGVGKMIQMAVEKGRSTKPDLIIGVCGEHGGDPASIEFLSKCGIDYVSCSPFRVPVARLAAAQAAIMAWKA